MSVRASALITCALAVVVSIALGWLSLLLPNRAEAAEPQPFGTVSSLFETAAYATHFDARTLEPIGPRVELGEYHGGWSFSPDGSQIAFGKSPAGGNTRDSVRIVDVASVTLERTGLTPAYIGPLAWVAPHALIGFLEDDTPILFDPGTGSITRRLPPLRSCGTRPTVVAGARALAIEPGALVSITATGVVRRAAIGWVPHECFRAALAVDVESRSAWVAAGPRLARIDLRRMRVTTPALPAPRLRGRSDRLAIVALEGGRLVISHQSIGGVPRGVEFVNTRARARKILARDAGAARLADGLVLTYNGGRRRSGRVAGGVQAFDARGELRYRLLRGRWVEDLEVAGGRAYAISAGRLWAIDISRGNVLARSSVDPQSKIALLEPR